MNRPILVACLGMIIGIIGGLYFDFSTTLIFFITLVSAMAFLRKKFKPITKILKHVKIIFKFNIIIIFIFSIFISFFYVRFRNTKELIAEIQSEAKTNKYTYSYKINIKGNYFILYLKQKKGAKEFEYGDVIKLKGELELPDEARNYGGFSQRNYYKAKGIYGIIYAEKAEKIGNRFSIGKLGSIIRTSIKDKLKKYLSEENTNLLSGILIGDKSELEDDMLENFRRSSLIHILCLSRRSCGIYYFMGTKNSREIPGEKENIYYHCLQF